MTKKLIIPGIEITGLFDNIKTLVDDLLLINPIVIDFKAVHISEAEINEKLQINIYRIVQEQINNILKHSKATRAEIILSKEGNNVILVISDNGIGCNTAKKKNGVGIRNIFSRAELCHGDIAVTSKPGKGYLIKVILPLVPNRHKGKLPVPVNKA
ncbi:MAG: hypothetical protein IPP72_18925 [Chitinophagaceae bacterium]|nr:hypothetical protein [Chitinophagaceae bacterium]